MSFFVPNRVRVESVQPYKFFNKLRDPDIWNDVNRFWQTFTTPILKSLARTFCVTAAKYSPPGRPGKQLGTFKISQIYYYTTIIDMNKYAKSPELRIRLKKDDWKMYRQGYMYKIISTKYRQKRKVLGYTRNYGQAMKLARIKNRGLAKYSWGSLLNNFSGSQVKRSKEFNTHNLDYRVGLYEVKLPSTFKNLAAKSPNIARYRWGTIKTIANDMQSGNYDIQITNHLTDSEKYCKIATEKGTQAVLKQWYTIVEAINNTSIDTLEDFLNFEINKINLKCNQKAKRKRFI